MHTLILLDVADRLIFWMDFIMSGWIIQLAYVVFEYVFTLHFFYVYYARNYKI